MRSTTDIDKTNDFRLYLQTEFLRRSSINPLYSIRAFARLLGTDFSALAKILSGKRKIGPITIRKLGPRVGLRPDQISVFTDKIKNPQQMGLGAEVDQPEYQQLTLDSFQIISDWYHYAILELMRVDDFKPDFLSIGRKLGISTTKVCVALERMKRVGILAVSPEGKWTDRSSGRSSTIGDHFTTSAFRNLQRQILEKAIIALEEIPFELRDQTSMTMAIDSTKLPIAREQIKIFRRKLSTFLSRGEKRDAVYHLSISLYPVTRSVTRIERKKI